MKQASLFDQGGAIIDGEYRYSLWRLWDPEQPRILFIMLNPSTADEDQDDATLRRCITFARSWQAGSLEVVNLYAYRATHPARLSQVTDATGPENDTHILRAVNLANRIICAWGAHKQAQKRSTEVLALLEGKDLYCLGHTRGGHPRHPLYTPNGIQPLCYHPVT